MRPVRMTDAHHTSGFAELVCSNSFRSDDAQNNAVGLLHAEMRRLGSLIMRAADANQVPAGGALAVDRNGFSAAVSQALENHPRITIDRAEVAGLPPATIISADIDPLASDSLLLTQKLRAAGVKTTYQPYEGVTHEFFGMGDAVADAASAQDLAARELREALRTGPARSN